MPCCLSPTYWRLQTNIILVVLVDVILYLEDRILKVKSHHWPITFVDDPETFIEVMS